MPPTKRSISSPHKPAPPVPSAAPTPARSPPRQPAPPAKCDFASSFRSRLACRHWINLFEGIGGCFSRITIYIQKRGSQRRDGLSGISPESLQTLNSPPSHIYIRILQIVDEYWNNFLRFRVDFTEGPERIIWHSG